MNQFFNVKICLFEEFKNNTQNTLSSIFTSLNIEVKKFNQFKVYNKSLVLKKKFKYLMKISWIVPKIIKVKIKKLFSKGQYDERKMHIDDDIITDLKNLHKEDIIELEKLLKTSLKSWKE